MILAPRRHLYATNIIIFFIILVLQKFITIFCIIEEKACKNKNCSAEQACGERCTAAAPSKSSSSSTTSSSSRRQSKMNKNLTLVPTSMRKAMRNFGFEEGHYHILVEEKQRYQPISEARLNAADAELKLNPN